MLVRNAADSLITLLEHDLIGINYSEHLNEELMTHKRDNVEVVELLSGKAQR